MGVRAHQVLAEAARARTTIPQYVLTLKLLVVLASSIGGSPQSQDGDEPPPCATGWGEVISKFPIDGSSAESELFSAGVCIRKIADRPTNRSRFFSGLGGSKSGSGGLGSSR